MKIKNLIIKEEKVLENLQRKIDKAYDARERVNKKIDKYENLYRQHEAILIALDIE